MRQRVLVLNYLKRILVICMLLGIALSNMHIQVNAATVTPNWESLYQTKIQQIEREYTQEKRAKTAPYDTDFYSLQDFDFDGVPELYHALVSNTGGEYNALTGSEEIYYIKNNKVELGNIQAHDTLGLLPAYTITDTADDRRWQMALYNTRLGEVCFVTKDAWTGSFQNGVVIFSELRFNADTGMLAVTELSRGRYNRGDEPRYPAGYEFVGIGSTYSDSRREDNDLWSWSAPYIAKSEVENTSETIVEPTWRDAYQTFILSEEYLKSKEQYNSSKNSGITFGLHDLDGDGLPELIIDNGLDVNHVYTYKDNSVTYLGKMGEKEATFKYAAGSGYPGLYWEGNSRGYFPGYYCYVKDGHLYEELVSEMKVEAYSTYTDFVETQVTEDDKLYQACRNAKQILQMYSREEITFMGWSRFVEDSLEQDNTLFEDVNLNSWFYESVKYVQENGIMSGVSETLFSPEEEVTRAMFVTMLYRMEKEPAVSVVQFSDVVRGSWYEKAVSWANKNGIVSGVEKRLFAPEDYITREQLATILYRYAKYKKLSTSSSDTAIKSFIDNYKVSDYAVEAMNWAIDHSLISGDTTDILLPEGHATRAQAAVILHRFCENLQK